MTDLHGDHEVLMSEASKKKTKSETRRADERRKAERKKDREGKKGTK